MKVLSRDFRVGGLVLCCLLAPIVTPRVSFLDDPRPCAESIGLKRAKKYVDQCMQVAPYFIASPPCNVQNRCGSILNSIEGSCRKIHDLNSADRTLNYQEPRFCRKYVRH
jgi:hypothetical protein